MIAIMVFMALLLTIDNCDISIQSNLEPTIGAPVLSVKKEPLFLERESNELVKLEFAVEDNEIPLAAVKMKVVFTDESALASLADVSVWYTGVDPEAVKPQLMASSANPGMTVLLKEKIQMAPGINRFVIDFAGRQDADLLGTISIKAVTITFSDKSRKKFIPADSDQPIRFGKVLREGGDDGCDTYRIPGLVTTNAGTLIAVYDIRYNSSKDLQEDIDIGMSRSTDGGQTWEPMKVIMDMGEYGGRPEQLNGTGDPCILFDHTTNTLWVTALWMSGSAPDKMLWWDSRPGMTPDETGQVMVVKSTDDGLTWSNPMNITSQIKIPEWQLMLQGPGRGITTHEGTIVFPAQFKEDIGVEALDGSQYTCHSTIIYSQDGGETWHTGTGAKPNTTEAQVVELSDGSLMLNMRDDRNRTDKGLTNGRAVAVTSDLGQTWTVHPSSNSVLPEPNCMGSIIATDLKVGRKKQNVLFFSNPNDKSSRTHMTIKTSLDEGLTWPEEYWLELFSPSCYGYSCMTMIDEQTLGIVYEGSKDLFFQKIRVSDFITGKKSIKNR